MKLVRWKRYIWDLTKLPPSGADIPARFNVRPAVREDERAASEVIFSSLAADNCWSDLIKAGRANMQAQLEAAFDQSPVPILVITHGQRIVAASHLSLEPDSDSNLLTGPCVLAEYRSRGLGTTLLYHSLKLLQGEGLTRACGLTKETAPTGKFVYRKFGGAATDFDFEPPLAKA